MSPFARLALMLVALLVLGATAYAARLAWLHRPAGVFALDPRDPPAPECTFVVQLDRESASGKPVQFGDLRCRGGDAAVLRIGGAWFALPETSFQSRYGTVRRSVDNRAWVAASDADYFRSDDGGETFFLLHLPNWGTEDVVHQVGGVEITGPALEHLAFTYEEKSTRFRRLRAALSDPAVTGLTDRWAALKEAWDDPGVWALGRFGSPHVRYASDDGGRSWSRR